MYVRVTRAKNYLAGFVDLAQHLDPGVKVVPDGDRPIRVHLATRLLPRVIFAWPDSYASVAMLKHSVYLCWHARLRREAPVARNAAIFGWRT